MILRDLSKRIILLICILGLPSIHVEFNGLYAVIFEFLIFLYF